MHHRQSPVAAFEIGADDPQGGHVVDLVERLLLALHLVPDAVKVLGPTAHITVGETNRSEPVAQQLHGDTQALLAVAALARHLLLHIAEGLGLEDLEGQVLQFPLEATNAETIGQRAVDLARFAGDALLLLGLQRPERAHVVQPVGQLH